MLFASYKFCQDRIVIEKMVNDNERKRAILETENEKIQTKLKKKLQVLIAVLGQNWWRFSKKESPFYDRKLR